MNEKDSPRSPSSQGSVISNIERVSSGDEVELEVLVPEDFSPEPTIGSTAEGEISDLVAELIHEAKREADDKSGGKREADDKSGGKREADDKSEGKREDDYKGKEPPNKKHKQDKGRRSRKRSKKRSKKSKKRSKKKRSKKRSKRIV